MVTAGLIWAPGEKRLLTQEKLGRSSRAGDGERKSALGGGVVLGWHRAWAWRFWWFCALMSQRGS